MSSWLVNPGYGPTSAPDANPCSVTGEGLRVKVMDRPADVPADAVGGRPYLSGQLQTKGSFAQQYGYFEARAKLPQGAGVSGAFWLLPADGSWPPELDVVESDGGGALAMTAHTLQTGAHTANEHWGDNVPGRPRRSTPTGSTGSPTGSPGTWTASRRPASPPRPTFTGPCTS
jgi:beta-glucanase (GH16 family)